MKQLYVEKRFSFGSKITIEQANKIIAEYQEQGFTLTLRQLYYQFVSRDLIANKMSEYKRLGTVINDARLAGLVDWDAIEDRTRNLQAVSTWENPAHIIRCSALGYKIDLWENQDNYCEVWVEKDALTGVIEPTCSEYRVPFFACRGYTSQSEQREAGRRLAEQVQAGKNVHILHLGDHDPSGIDMTRDNDERLKMFIAGEALDSAQFHLKRLALNMDQVKKHRPPPNPAKMTDSRFAEYARNFGKKSWELDALDPKVIADLLSTNIRRLIDRDTWDKDKRREDRDTTKLHTLAKKLDK